MPGPNRGDCLHPGYTHTSAQHPEQGKGKPGPRPTAPQRASGLKQEVRQGKETAKARAARVSEEVKPSGSARRGTEQRLGQTGTHTRALSQARGKLSSRPAGQGRWQE